MNLIYLPVAPITRCILLTDFEAEPIAPPRKNILFHKLHYRSPDTSKNSARIRKILTAEIALIVPADLSDHLLMYGEDVGYHLYLQDVERMMRWTAALKSTGVPAMTALKSFYDSYDIGEDDFALESAYKRWQRFILEKPGSYLNISSRKRVQNSNEKSWSELSSDVGHFVRKNYNSYFFLDGQFNIQLLRKTYLWFLVRVKNIPVRVIARKNNLSFQNIYYHISDMDRRLENGSLKPI